MTQRKIVNKITTSLDLQGFDQILAYFDFQLDYSPCLPTSQVKLRLEAAMSTTGFANFLLGVTTIVQETIVQGDICLWDFCLMTLQSKQIIVQ